MKILISGGHLTPALAFIDYALQKHDQIIFVGRAFSQHATQQKSHEEREVLARGVHFIPFDSAKLHHTNLQQILGQIYSFVKALFMARKIMKKHQPDVFLSFGGYLAVPIAIAAWSLSIPVVTHEQTKTAGVANRTIAFFAQKVAVSYAETLHFFPKRKTLVTGNPLRENIFLEVPPAPSWFHFSQRPILYITGGSQGSERINDVIKDTLPQLTTQWSVIHACGPENKKRKYRDELEKTKSTLSHEAQKFYHVQDWFGEYEIAWIYRHAMCIVGRSGANTTAEIMRAGKPALFIPLQFAHGDEQRKNAEFVIAEGAGEIVEQKDFTPEKFLSLLDSFLARKDIYLEAARKNKNRIEHHGTQKLYAVVQELHHVQTHITR